MISAASVATRILGFVNAPTLQQKVVKRCLNEKTDISYYDRNRETDVYKSQIIVCFFITVESPVLRVVLRIALIPLIAGISYEMIRLAGNSDNPVVEILSKPGLALQNLTTKEPEDDMIEVAIKAVEEVFDWKEYLRENFGADVR